jgi:hypothetical protein
MEFGRLACLLGALSLGGCSALGEMFVKDRVHERVEETTDAELRSGAACAGLQAQCPSQFYREWRTPRRRADVRL